MCVCMLSHIIYFNSFGCYNKIPETGQLAHRYLFLTILDADDSKIKTSADSVSGEKPLLRPCPCHLT